MSSRTVGILIGLYPRAWRRRYGAELHDLVVEMSRRGERPGWRLGSDLILAAAGERLRGSRRQAAGAVLLLGVVATVAVVVALGAHPGPSTLTAQAPRPHSHPHHRATRYRATAYRATTPLGHPCFVGAGSACGGPPCRELIATARAVSPTDAAHRAIPATTGSRCASGPDAHPHTLFVQGSTPSIAVRVSPARRT